MTKGPRLSLFKIAFKKVRWLYVAIFAVLQVAWGTLFYIIIQDPWTLIFCGFLVPGYAAIQFFSELYKQWKALKDWRRLQSNK